MAHRVEPAPSARAKCRGCGERIATGELRFGESYFETTDLLPRVRRFSTGLREEDLAELLAEIDRSTAPEA